MAQPSQDNEAYIRDLVRQADQDCYWSALLAPEPARGELLALYAFNIELSRIPGQVSEPQLGEIRLQWWREALKAAFDGETADHPVLAGLAKAASSKNLPRDRLLGMIDAHRFDLDDELMRDFAELERYLEGTAGAVFQLASQILGAGDERALSRDAGLAHGLTGLMRALPLHASRGRVFLPQSLFAKHGLHPSIMFQGGDNADLRAALRDVRQKASEALGRFRQQAVSLPRHLRPAFLPLALVRPMLRKLAATGHHPLREIARLNPLQRYGLIWRAYLLGRF